MSLAADRRGRIPFALVGVLLLLGATAYSTGVSERGPTTVDNAAEAATDAAVRDLRPAFREAIRRAAVEAALHPVTTPADTPAGSVLNESTAFRDALRVRIALAVADAAAGVRRDRAAVVATAALPPVRSISDLRAAKRRIRLNAVRNGHAVRVTVRDVTVTARRGGSVVASERFDLSLTVAIPVLALHDRTARFERRLNRQPLAGPGLGRSLTVRLYPLAWARGYAHYAGAPVADVLGNHHVELATNTAILAQQRAAFGRVDPDTPAEVEAATLRVLVRDGVGPHLPGIATATRAILRSESATTGASDPRDESVTVSAARRADRSFLSVVDEVGLEDLVTDVYRVEGSLQVTVERTRPGRAPTPESPGSNWTLTASRDSTTSVVTGTGRTTRRTGDRFELRAVRTVTVRHDLVRVWRHRDGTTRTVERSWREAFRVTVALSVRHAPTDAAPDRAVRPLFRRGGVLDGRNLGGTVPEARERLLSSRGGIDAVARRAVTEDDRPEAATVTLVGDRPTELREWLLADLLALHRQVRNQSVTVAAERVAAGRANPPARLAAILRQRRAGLLDAPRTYDGVADRARVAVRAAYLDDLIRGLEADADRVRSRNRNYLAAAGVESAAELSKLVSLEASNRRTPRTRGAFVPDGSPAYLSLAARTGPDGGEFYPLAARTTNWFTLPHGDVGEAAGEAVMDTRAVDLATAGHALVTANDALSRRPNATLRNRRNSLDAAVEKSLRTVRRRAARGLRRAGIAPRQSDRLTRRVLDRWGGNGHGALAVANGSFARALAAEARSQGIDERRAVLLTVRLRVEIRDVLSRSSVRIPASTTNATASATRRVAAAAVEEATATGLERAARRWGRLGSGALPSGLPIAPPPATWYATANGWSVTVRGGYHAFVVRARSGAPDGAGAVTRYVRDGTAVWLDVDGDGERELLGRADRITFAVSTVVVVAVPPGPPGVGDTDGDRDEQSPGWPCPNLAGSTDCPRRAE